MKKLKNKKLFLGVFALIILSLILIDGLNQDGPGDLAGKLQEHAFVRNEQNTGPVVRLYVVSIEDTLWKEMETYVNYMPHTKYGVTKVFYFLRSAPVPENISLEGSNIEKEYQKYCIAEYQKNEMSQARLIKHPFIHVKN